MMCDYIQHSDKNSLLLDYIQHLDKNQLCCCDYIQQSDNNSYVAVIIYSIQIKTVMLL